jgi:potassium-transporting ATPase KdpC subunit
MKRDLLISLRAVVVLTVVLGVAYPLAVTGAARVGFPSKAAGSRIEHDGRVLGSRLIGETFRRQARYFQPRPSQTSYNPAETAFSNRGPNQAAARTFFRDQLAAYLRREQPYDHGLTAAAVPVDAVSTSGSGIDPHISPANARVQAHRVAAVRHLALASVLRLVDSHTDGRSLGLLGEPGVNVLELNLALDRMAP